MTANRPEPLFPPYPPRRRWQFGFSTLLLVVTACALASWWYSQESSEAFQERFTKRVSDLGGELRWKEGEKPTRVSFKNWGPTIAPNSKPLSDDQLRKLRRDLTRLGPFSLNLGGAVSFVRGEITDAGLSHLRGLDQLECLVLRHSEVTDAGLEPLAGLKGLQLLDLRDTPVTEAGVRGLTSVRPDLIALTDRTEKQMPSGDVSAAGPPVVPARATVTIPPDALGRSMRVRPELSIGLYTSDPDVHVKWLSATDAVISLHGPISDSGVFVARVDATRVDATAPANAKLVWQAFAEPLGVDHSKYRHEVQLVVAGDRCVVVSDGAETFVEIRELATGKLLKRWVY